MASKRWMWVLRFVVAATILTLLYIYVDFAQVGAMLRRADPRWLAASVVVLFVGNVLIAYRWRVLLQTLDLHPRLGRIFQAYLKGHFIAYFVPTALSADVYKAIDIGRETRAMGSVTSAILMERALGMLSTASIVFAAVAGMEAVLERIGVGASLALAAGVIVIGFVVMLQLDRVLRLLRRPLSLFGTRLLEFVEKMGGALARYRRRPGLLTYSFVLSIVIQFGRGLSVWLIARALGDPTSFAYFLVFVPLVFLVNMLPLAGSRLGVEQGAFVVFFGAVGMPEEAALSIGFLTLILGFLVALPGGYWLLRRG